MCTENFHLHEEEQGDLSTCMDWHIMYLEWYIKSWEQWYIKSWVEALKEDVGWIEIIFIVYPLASGEFLSYEWFIYFKDKYVTNFKGNKKHTKKHKVPIMYQNQSSQSVCICNAQRECNHKVKIFQIQYSIFPVLGEMIRIYNPSPFQVVVRTIS